MKTKFKRPKGGYRRVLGLRYEPFDETHFKVVIETQSHRTIGFGIPSEGKRFCHSYASSQGVVLVSTTHPGTTVYDSEAGPSVLFLFLRGHNKERDNDPILVPLEWKDRVEQAVAEYNQGIAPEYSVEADDAK